MDQYWIGPSQHCHAFERADFPDARNEEIRGEQGVVGGEIQLVAVSNDRIRGRRGQQRPQSGATRSTENNPPALAVILRERTRGDQILDTFL
jgi:hypothetical protein